MEIKKEKRRDGCEERKKEGWMDLKMKEKKKGLIEWIDE